MDLSSIKKRVSNYLSGTKSWPLIVDLQTREDLAEISEFFKVGENVFLNAEEFCKADGTFKLEEIENAITHNEGDTFIIGLTTFLKLNGEQYTRNSLKSIAAKSINGHIVILTYQCKNYLKFNDTRYFDRGSIIIAPGEPDDCVEICLISPELEEAFPGCYDGFENISHIIETTEKSPAYIATNVSKRTFSDSMIYLQQMNNGYEIVCKRDSKTTGVPKEFGTNEQWIYALKCMGSHGNWRTVISEQLGSVYSLAFIINDYSSFDPMKKWLYFIAVSLYGVEGNDYLQLAIDRTNSSDDLIRNIYESLLYVDVSDKSFEKLYSQRKALLRCMPDAIAEVTQYCKHVSLKEKDQINFLTDSTMAEREKIIEWLDKYGCEFSSGELFALLKNRYSDLAYYMTKFRFRNDLLDDYFEKYKYQKLTNHLIPEFIDVVDDQAAKNDFVTITKTRTEVVDKLALDGAHAYFVDALGVEFLGFIQSKCSEYGLSANIGFAHCELPSLTCFNKEFVETLQSKGCKVSDIKELDEIKHHGENNFDYEKVKTPIYLITELSIIDGLLKKISANIQNETYEKEIIISDHGASRLAVLYDKENIWSMSTSGVHSGRCCPVNDINEKPDNSIEYDDYWVLANYDRFRGGRRANVEVHGGATLEEVIVPIIEITKKLASVEAFIESSTKVIMLGVKDVVKLKLFVGVKSGNISILLNGKYYDAEKTVEDYVYTVTIPDIKSKGIYSFDILMGSDTIATSQQFEVKKKGMAIGSLFD